MNRNDSSYYDLDLDSKAQICSILKHAGKSLTFDRSQRGVSDCGLFSIAFAVGLCIGNNPQIMVIDQKDTGIPS